jgi:hypothetical protein
MHLFRGICGQYGMMCEPDEVFAYLEAMPEQFEQMTLF